MSIVRTVVRLLTFQITREELLELDLRHLATGIAGTWIVGMGRYWDDPGAKLLQHLGLGSIIYIFALSLFIWLIVKPYFVERWSYFTVLVFVSLTSFPAVFYAIPVERFFEVNVAGSINAWFLAVVAAWRLALLYFFLKRFTQLGHEYILIGTFLPVCFLIAALTILNLERSVFDIMGGFRNSTSKDAAYQVLVALSMLSVMLVGPLLLAYGIAIFNRWRLTRNKG